MENISGLLIQECCARFSNEIDALEKTTLDVNKFTQTEENFMPWVLAAICAVVLQLLIRYTLLRRIP